MTVEEAKQKVCPFIQMPQESFDIAGLQRVQNIRCICGECMAWVFTKSSVSYKNGEVEYHCDFSGKELSNDEKEGYCKMVW